MICRTSSGVSSAATSSLTWRHTQSTASSKSKTGRGGLPPRRRASRPMTTAAITKTQRSARAAKTTTMPPEGYAASDSDALGEELPVVRRVAEEELGGLGPLEVEVGVVLPREADAAMDLDVLGGGVEVGVRAVRLGQAGHCGELVVQLSGGPARVVGGRLGRLDLEQHVGALVLDGLEA